MQTPNLDRLASESALFTRAFATDIPTQPSHTALFTGRYGITTGIVSHFHPPANLDEEVAWLPSLFRRAGHRTAAVDHLFSMKKWFRRGYDDYLVPPGRSRSPASVINALAFEWLDNHYDEDFFLFLHYWDAHIPYLPPEPFNSKYTAAIASIVDPEIQMKLCSRPSYALFKKNHYDHLGPIPSLQYIEALHYAEIAYLDYELGLLFDHLETLDVLDDCMIVIFGDHGEIMTEHDAWFDHAGLYNSIVHVPLMIRAPGSVPASRIDDMVALIDVMPTVLELQDLADAAVLCDGRSLVPLIEGGRGDRDTLVLSECTWQAKRAVLTDRWKYIRSWDEGIYPRAQLELYDLHVDPDEQRNLADAHPDVVRRLGEYLDSWLTARLAGRPDPLVDVLQAGLPAVRRLEGVLREEAAASRADDFGSTVSLGPRDRPSSLSHRDRLVPAPVSLR